MKVILSYGMGVDSSAILLRWLEMSDRQRGFKLKDLIVVTAMTGNEFPASGRLVKKYILPELRKHNVRFVQVARAGALQTAGTTVLGDSRNPKRLALDGNFRLSDEMIQNGTVPQMGKSMPRPGKAAGKGRLCSIHAKGWPLDAAIVQLLAGETFRTRQHLPYERTVARQKFKHVIGFNADEANRRDRDISYSGTEDWPGRQSWYPLFDWKWGRKACEDYLEARVGEPWAKSCCFFCPFTAASEMTLMIDRQMRGELDVPALFIEYLSMCLNWRQALYTFPRSLRQEYLKRGLDDPIAELDDSMSDLEWAVVHLRRLMPAEARSIQLVAEGLDRGAAERKLAALARKRGATLETKRGTRRAYLQHRATDFVGQTTEEFLVAIPNEVNPKQATGFEAMWERWSALRPMFEELYARFEVPDPKDKHAPLKAGRPLQTATAAWSWLDRYLARHDVPITDIELVKGKVRLGKKLVPHAWVTFELVKDTPSTKTGRMLKKRAKYLLDPAHNKLRPYTNATSSVVLMGAKSRFAKLYVPKKGR